MPRHHFARFGFNSICVCHCCLEASDARACRARMHSNDCAEFIEGVAGR